MINNRTHGFYSRDWIEARRAVVYERLSHRDVSITLNTYAHVLEGHTLAAADRIGALLHGLGLQTVSKILPSRLFWLRFLEDSANWGG